MDVFQSHKVIDRLQLEGYEFNIGKYLDGGWNLFKKKAVYFVLFAVLSFLISIAISFALSLIPVVGSLIANLLTVPLYFGFYVVMHNMYHDQPVDFGDFFKGFTYFGPLAVIYLIQLAIILIISLLSSIPFFTLFPWNDVFSGSFDPADMQAFMINILTNGTLIAVFAILFIILLYLFISWTYANLIAVFHNVNPWQAMEASRKIITKKFFHFLLLYIIFLVVNVIGMIPFGLGLFITIPFTVSTIYFSFEDIIGQKTEEDNEDMSEHLVSDQ